ncbi:MAG: 50S ribosome-binding protein YggL [Thalassotalea sp.]
MHSQKSRRLRKKLFLSEFAVMGVELDCNLTCKEESELATIMDDFFIYLESLSLVISGGGDLTSFAGFISSHERYGSVTETDITSISNWLKNQSIVAEFNIGKLVDAYYGT